MRGFFIVVRRTLFHNFERGFVFNLHNLKLLLYYFFQNRKITAIDPDKIDPIRVI